jgi:hypothetical protein
VSSIFIGRPFKDIVPNLAEALDVGKNPALYPGIPQEGIIPREGIKGNLYRRSRHKFPEGIKRAGLVNQFLSLQ